MPSYTLLVNGQRHPIDADPAMPMLWALRDRLALLGTKYGCGVGTCGACTIHEDGRAVRSCTLPVSATEGKAYVTVEGLSSDGSHACQRAWLEEDVSQCGFCQAGMLMQAAALLREKPHPTTTEIDAALATHVCRCGTYLRLRKAVHRAAELLAR